MAEKKDIMIEEYLKKGVVVGDKVIVEEGLLYPYAKCPQRSVSVMVKETYDDGRILVANSASYRDDVVLSDGQYKLDTYHIGANPFPKKSWRSAIRTLNFDLSSILHRVGVVEWADGKWREHGDINIIDGVRFNEANFNPYVFESDGTKFYYQRDYCWTNEQEKLFIESIYNSINCGMIVVRKRSWEWVTKQIENGNEEVSFWDIVDGKQRLNALIRFVCDKFKDLHGNYFSDLSDWAKNEFLDSMVISYAELGETAIDEDVIETFLGVNHTGTPMAKEHIESVKSIQGKLK